MPTGYTAIETYVNELSDRLVGAEPPAATVSSPGANADPRPAAGSGAGASSGRAASTTPMATVAPVANVSNAGGGLVVLALVASAAAMVLSACTLLALLRRTRPLARE